MAGMIRAHVVHRVFETANYGGADHVMLDEPFVKGRLRRKPGDTLCHPASFWRRRADFTHGHERRAPSCRGCIELLDRHDVRTLIGREIVWLRQGLQWVIARSAQPAAAEQPLPAVEAGAPGEPPFGPGLLWELWKLNPEHDMNEWTRFHDRSQQWVRRAEILEQMGHPELAAQAYQQAATAEQTAMSHVPLDRPRTLGITAVSAATLWTRARSADSALALVARALSMPAMPAFAIAQLCALRSQQLAGPPAEGK